MAARSKPWSRLWLTAPLVSAALSVGLLFVLVPSLARELEQLRARLGRAPSSQRDVARAEIAAICRALEAWAADNEGVYPGSLEVLFTPDERGVTYLRARSERADSR